VLKDEEFNMTRDVDIINQLERKINKKLSSSKLDNIIYDSNGYVVNESKNIVGLNLYQLEISDISFLKNLKNLTQLYLWESQISDISDLEGLSNLTQLYLWKNQISDISALRNLSHLTVLNLASNRISNISILKDLKHLSDLNLADNQISDISALKGLTGLKTLNLAANRISDIAVLKGLTGLTDLNLTNNKISHLPVEIVDGNMEIKWEFDLSKGIFLEGNPLENLPVEIVKRGRDAIKSYFKSLKGEKRAINEVKVIFVGDGEVGKTSLVKQLLGEAFDEKEPQTQGININHWEVEEGGEIIKTHLWDFGGQEIMHATHQFFLSKRSLYVLVLDSRKETKTEYWLKHIETSGGNSPVLVVINKIDENPGFDVNRKFLKEKYRNIRKFYRVSCATKQGFDDFSQNLARELKNVELTHTTWGPNWFKVKTQLENMTDNYISSEKYEEICENEGITDEESQDTLVEFLNDLGIILHFNDPALKETTVTNPRWATEAVYKIITSKELAENKGVLSKNSLRQILDKKKYPIRKHDFIIELMKKFGLCFSLDNDTILIPDLLAVGEPGFEFDYDTSLRFIIRYDFLPKSIMPRFIVDMRRNIKENLRWRTGVVLEDRGFDSSAVIKKDERERKISIFVQGKQKRDYLSVIRKLIRDINDDFEHLNYSEWVPLTDNNEILVEYKDLIGLERLREEFITIGKLGKKYPVKALLDGIEHEMSRKFPIQPITFKWDVFISYSKKDISKVKAIVNDLEANNIRYWWDEEQIEPGDVVQDKIENGLRESRCVMPCLSRNQIHSGWSRMEYRGVLNAVINGKTGQKILPLIIDDLEDEEIPISLNSFKYERRSHERGYNKLLQALKKS
jgi:internalin A